MQDYVSSLCALNLVVQRLEPSFIDSAKPSEDKN